MKKVRDQIWIYGRHAVKAALENPMRRILRIVLMDQEDPFVDLAKIRSINPEFVDINFFNSHFGVNSVHQKCAVLAKKLPEVFLQDVVQGEDMRPIVCLDQITDPQNIGSILRASAVFNARAVVVTEKHSPDMSTVSIKASSGASEIVPIIRVVNLSDSIKYLQKHGFWSVGLDERASKNLSDLPSKTKFAIIIGAEGKGMRKLTKENCDFLVKIPSNENFSTLNAAQATTVALYEIFKMV